MFLEDQILQVAEKGSILGMGMAWGRNSVVGVWEGWDQMVKVGVWEGRLGPDGEGPSRPC